jgi:hypothetical protein
MLKKTMMTAMATAVVAAFAIPAAATASLWKHHNQNLATNAQIDLTGQTKFQGEVGSIECQRTMQITLTAGTGTGNITKFEPDLDEAGSTVTSKCKAAGFLAACQVHSAVSEGLPWVIHNETQRIEITSGKINVGLTGGFCPAQGVTVTAVNAANGHTVTATPNQPHTVTSFTLAGQVEIDVYNGAHDLAHQVIKGTANFTGTQTIVDTGAGQQSRPHTYSLT